MLSFSKANYWDLNVPFTNIRHFPLIITKPHNFSGPFKMHTKMLVILQPCWRSCCKCRVCNALVLSWRAEMEAAHLTGKGEDRVCPERWNSGEFSCSLNVLSILPVVALSPVTTLRESENHIGHPAPPLQWEVRKGTQSGPVPLQDREPPEPPWAPPGRGPNSIPSDQLDQ